jgi:hypothetical protein
LKTSVAHDGQVVHLADTDASGLRMVVFRIENHSPAVKLHSSSDAVLSHLLSTLNIPIYGGKAKCQKKKS